MARITHSFEVELSLATTRPNCVSLLFKGGKKVLNLGLHLISDPVAIWDFL